jgi:hypothetical protein
MSSPERLILVRDLHHFDETRQQHAQSAAHGREVRVARGAYIDAPFWAGLGARDRYLLTIRAVAGSRGSRPVLSHLSAAAIHGLPIVGPWPQHVHVTQPVALGTRSRGPVVRHSLSLTEQDVVEIDGLLVTSLVRTVIDLAAAAAPTSALAAMDAALHVDRFEREPARLTAGEILRSWEARLPFRGHARARELIEFGVPNADSPIESVSRWNMRLIGCPPPILQQSHFDAQGFIADTDFSWPEFDTVGEADGDQKYLDPAFRGGRSAERVVLDEKIREDRLRALPKVVVRWRWAVALAPELLRRKLVGAGIPMTSRR